MTLLFPRRSRSTLDFATAAITIVPLSKIVGNATETLAGYLGPTLGGLLNASMGNAPELIIGIFALKNGLIKVVKASLMARSSATCCSPWEWRCSPAVCDHPNQKFNVAAARLSMSMMFLAVAGLMIPALFHFTSPSAEREISLQIAAILLARLWLEPGLHAVHSPQIVRYHAGGRARGGEDPLVEDGPRLLAAATVVLALMSESPHRSTRPGDDATGHQRGFRRHHPPGLGQQHLSIMNAAVFARKNQMDLAVSSVIGAATQIALLVAPALVFASLLLARANGPGSSTDSSWLR